MLVTAVALGSALAGCGGSSPPRNASSGSSKPAGGIAAEAYRFAACMRDHGFPTFPNPHISTSGSGAVVSIKMVGPGPKHGKPLPKACRGILPGPGNESSPQQQAARDQARRAGLLSFAACMRTHGVPSFPDPGPQGQFTLQMVTAAHVDIHAAPTLTAIKACEGASHGIVTPAAVGQALQQTSTSSG